MNSERKLSLVKPPAPSGEGPASPVEHRRGLRPDKPGSAPIPPLEDPRLDLPADEIEPTDEELREAEALRKALDRGEDPLAQALRAAFRPAPLADSDLDAILARAMGDLDAPPTAIEERDADRLRVALDEHDAQRAGRLLAGPGARTTVADDSAAATAVALRTA